MQIDRKNSLIIDHRNSQVPKGLDYCDSVAFNKYAQTLNQVTKGKNPTVMLIGGGMSAEKDVSLMSCTGISNSICELNYDLVFVDMGADIARVIEFYQPEKIFNGLHGTYGEDGNLPGLLNIMQIPYTGSGVIASSIGFNKKISLDIFKTNGFTCAKSVYLTRSNIHQYLDKNGKAMLPFEVPFVIKPLSQGSSVGVEIITPEDDFQLKDYDFPYGDILVEQYIKGREIQVAVLDGKALGVLEIKLLKGQRFYDYQTKYTDGWAEHVCPAQLPDKITKEALALSEFAYNIIGARSMVRVEFLYCESSEKLYLLELNTHPGMTKLSICPEIALKMQNITYNQIVKQLLDNATYES